MKKIGILEISFIIPISINWLAFLFCLISDKQSLEFKDSIKLSVIMLIALYFFIRKMIDLCQDQK